MRPIMLLYLLGGCPDAAPADTAPKDSPPLDSGCPVTWYADADGDSFGDPADTSCDPIGRVADATDCDDGDAGTHPGADETCDDADEDCDGAIDEDAIDMSTGYADGDGDGWGAEPVVACHLPEGTVDQDGDCDDADPATFPGAPEAGDGADNDCDGTIDEGTARGDDDGDGYAEVEGDCDDADPAVSPAAEEHCDGVDEDCDGTLDEDAVDAPTWHPDDDGDSYGAADTEQARCTAPAGWTADGSDCDDHNWLRYPGAEEGCGGADDDCDGLVDDDDPDVVYVREPDYYADADADGFGDPATGAQACAAPAGRVEDATDCDDTDASIHPGAAEVCDGIDADCAGDGDYGATGATTTYTDADGDGYGDDASPSGTCTPDPDALLTGGDCDDGDAEAHPGAREVCGNGVDEDCDGAQSAWCNPWGVEEDTDALATFAGTSSYGGLFLAVGDLDGDGQDDLATVSAVASGGSVLVWYGPLTGALAEADADLEITAADPDESLGMSMTTADTDGNGVDELVLPAPTWGTDAGRVYVIRTAGRVGTMAASDADAIVEGAPGDSLGESVDCGDVDGDGLDDLLVGAPGGATHGRGEAWLYTATSLAGALTRSDASSVFVAEVHEQDLGDEVAILGDLDGDGAVDLGLASGRYDTWLGYGVIWLIAGPIPAGETDLRRHDWGIEGTFWEGSWGRRLDALGDVDADGYADFAVGSPGTFGSSGAVHVVHGPPPRGWSQLDDVDVTISGQSDCESGAVVAGLGDLDADGRDDLGFTCSWRGSDPGGVMLEYGPIDADLSTSTIDYFMELSGYYQGRSMAAGDLDGDGYTDVAVGAYDNWFAPPGSIVVVRGGPSRATELVTPTTPGDDADGDGLTRADGDCDDSRAEVHPGATDPCGDGLDLDCDGLDPHCAPEGSLASETEYTWIGPGADGSSPGSAAVGDLDGDGHTDLVIGDPYQDGPSDYNLGVAGVIYGPLPRWDTTLDGADARWLGEIEYDDAGAAVAVGDLDGDGVDDLAVGATYADYGAKNAGRVYIWFGGVRVTGDLTLGDADGVIDATEESAHFGSALAIGDFDGDGQGDLAVAAVDATGDVAGAGALYVYTGASLSSDRTTADAYATRTGEAKGAGLADLVVGDADDDGAPDLLLAAQNLDTGAAEGAVYILRGPLAAGSASLATADVRWTHPSERYLGTGVNLGDVDNDGSTDVLVGTWKSYAYIRHGPLVLGDEAIDAHTVQLVDLGGAYYATAQVGALDLDADGAQELLVQGERWVAGWYGPTDPSGTVTTATAGFGTGESSSSTYTGPPYFGADLDGDGYQDLVDVLVGTSSGDVVVVWGGRRD